MNRVFRPICTLECESTISESDRAEQMAMQLSVMIFNLACTGPPALDWIKDQAYRNYYGKQTHKDGGKLEHQFNIKRKEMAEIDILFGDGTKKNSRKVMMGCSGCQQTIYHSLAVADDQMVLTLGIEANGNCYCVAHTTKTIIHLTLLKKKQMSSLRCDDKEQQWIAEDHKALKFIQNETVVEIHVCSLVSRQRLAFMAGKQQLLDQLRNLFNFQLAISFRAFMEKFSKFLRRL